MSGTPSGACVGNAFMRSETLDNLRSLINGNFPRHIFEVFPFSPPVLKQDCAECMNAFPTQKWTFRFKMQPRNRYRAGNGVTITANPRAKLAAGPPRRIPIYRGSTGRGAQELWVDWPRFVTNWPRGLPDKFHFPVGVGYICRAFF